MTLEIKNTYTRKVAKDYLKRVYKDAVMNWLGDEVPKQDSINEANDWLIAELCGVKVSEVEELDAKEWGDIYAEAKEMSAPQ